MSICELGCRLRACGGMNQQRALDAELGFHLRVLLLRERWKNCRPWWSTPCFLYFTLFLAHNMLPCLWRSLSFPLSPSLVQLQSNCPNVKLYTLNISTLTHGSICHYFIAATYIKKVKRRSRFSEGWRLPFRGHTLRLTLGLFYNKLG